MQDHLVFRRSKWPWCFLQTTKGGSGKTTAAMLLAGELLSHNARIVLLEGDPNRPLMAWAQARGAPVIETSRTRVRTAADALL